MKKTVQILGSIILGIGLSLIFFIQVFRWVNPPFTSFTLQENWEVMEQDLYNLRTYWVPRDEIPDHMVWAVVAAEDQLFFEHYGFDLESIEDAWEERQQGERIRGASTISQQVAKNLFLTSAQNFFRKGLEAAITVGLELFWPKDRIIEVYLNTAQFGPGIYGIGKASEVYFNTQASELTPEMASRFAAVLPSPSRMRINPPSPYTQERSRWILRQMNQLTGKIYYAFEKDNAFNDSTQTVSDSLAADTTAQMNRTDSLALNTAPDTLFRNLPDTTVSVSDNTSDSL